MKWSGHVVTDTHAFIWHLRSDPRLPRAVREIFAGADEGTRRIYVPSISIVETIYLVERGRVAKETIDLMQAYVNALDRPYHLADLDANVVAAVRQVPRDAVPDMPDRIIAATARSLGYPLITADERIHSSGVVEVIWQGEEHSESPKPPTPGG